LQYDYGEFREMAAFSWNVPIYGFCWDDNVIPLKELVHGKEQKLVEKEYIKTPLLVENPETTLLRTYLPFEEEPTLFLKFADTKTTLDEILKFANQYGKLSSNHGFLINIEEIMFVPLIEVKSKEDRYKLCYPNSNQKSYYSNIGEPFNYWETEINSMKNAIRLWNWIRDEDVGKLSQVINWDNSGFNVALGDSNEIKAFRTLSKKEQAVSYFNFKIQYNSYKKFIEKKIFELIKTDEIVLPAKIVLNNLINKKLAKYPLRLRLLLDEKNEPKQFVVPDNLLGAMWFQLFQSITGEKKYKKCAVCGTWENVTEKRTDWLYHDSCGSTFRGRKRRGIQDVLNGKKSLEEVAKHCGVSVSLIKEWLKSRNKGE
jgi:hypothetical protein